MERKVIFLVFLVNSLSITAQETTYPYDAFYPGTIWEDSGENHINAHGGGIMFKGDTYYWYGEHKGKSSKARVGINVYSSKDLYNWKKEGVALAVEDDPDSEITGGSVMERPKVVYNEKTGKYVMWFHLELKGQGYAAARTGLAVSDNPTGPFEYLKSFRPNAGVWPKNFKEEWKETPEDGDAEEWWTDEWYKALNDGMFVRRDFEDGQMARDMTVFVDDDGTAYHIHSSEENQTLHISELTDDYLGFTDNWVRVKPGGQNEAPTIFKHKEHYYMITSGLTGWEPNKARSFKAESVMGPWKGLGNPAKGEEANVTFRSQSTFVLPVQGKENAYIFMADRWKPDNHIDGRYIWLPIEFKNDKPIIEWHDQWDLSFFNEE
ncbi:beta-glucanase [Salegentibacter salinarum]|uniref:Beta-glucanase n=1 Tax=Salegentibacter salinarum TaxID=447422 RepID=A0A2N0TSM7_9FLAO|nr:glycoside hydrolase family 43 protein [Salegentibacter salinarum]PKD17744.1 beta-glucanase [Salegentibacter salinarum]SKB51188.1 Glycosyl hydrolases family 43 [Salegentibacter salinarum]